MIPRPFYSLLVDARPRSVTQALAAERVGVSRATLSSWERGISAPSARDLARLLNYYAAPPDTRLAIYDAARSIP